MCVVGDRNQLVYDFDDSFPATLDTLLRCDRLFGGTWKHHVLNGSRRLTKHMVRLVNEVFKTCISSEKEGCRVDVRSPTNIFDMHSVLHDVMERTTFFFLWIGSEQTVLCALC